MAEQQALNLAIKGLYSHADTLSEVPNGALSVAQNIVVDREGIGGSRRGVDLYNQTLSIPGGFNQLFFYRDRLFAHTHDNGAGTLYRDDNAGSWTEVANILPPDADSQEAGFKIRGAAANRNIYITTDRGIVKMDDPLGDVYDAGMPKGLGGDAVTDGSGSGFMDDDTAVAYRIIWGNKDANKNLILGAPSQRIIATNSTGTSQNVEITFDIPLEINENHLYQIYRSDLSASATDAPDDELKLVFENNPTTAEITAKQVVQVDNLPDSLKRATIYTAQSQQGIDQSNETPPYCKDMTVYKNHTFFANTKQKQRLFLTVIAVGGPDGLQVGDTVTIADIVYTGASVENVSNNEFQVDETGTPSQNIDTTTRSLVRVMNQSATNDDTYGYYISGFDDLPGNFLVETREVGAAEFYAISTRGGAFDPILPVSGTSIASDDEEKQHRVYFSKIQQPEAVPLLNFFDIGSADEPIQRIIALRESVFVFKPDGIFRIIGETRVNFRVLTADNTTQLKAPETAVTHNNSIIMWSEQGIITVSENGDVSILSRPIEQELLEIATYESFQTGAFAVSYESDRKYIVFIPPEEGENERVDKGYIYNSLTKSWSNWNIGGWLEDKSDTTKHFAVTAFGFGSGIVDPTDDKLVLGTDEKQLPVNDSQAGEGEALNTTLKERKAFTRKDYVDTEITQGVYSVPDSTTIVLDTTISSEPGATDGRLIGVLLQQEGFLQTVVANEDQVIDGFDRTVFTVESTQGWTASKDVDLLLPIITVIQWVPQHGGNPGILKHFHDITFFFDNASFDNVEASFFTDFSNESDKTTLVPSSLLSGTNLWGLFNWGEVEWGGGPAAVSQQTSIRTYVARETSRAHWLSVKLLNDDALSKFEVTGVSILYTPMSQKFRGVK